MLNFSKPCLRVFPQINKVAHKFHQNLQVAFHIFYKKLLITVPNNFFDSEHLKACSKNLKKSIDWKNVLREGP